jgi:hypothetical protein
MFNKFQKIVRGVLRLQAEASYYLKLLLHTRNLPLLSADEQAIVTDCRQEGVCMTSLAALKIPATAAMLDVAQRYLAIMEQVATPEMGNDRHPALPQIFTVTDLSEFQAWAQDPKMMRVVENYVGVPIRFQGAHLRRDFANETPVTTEQWHRDDEDRRIIKVFIYLTDVGIEHGPFEYVPRQLSWRRRRRVLSKMKASRQQWQVGINDEEMAALVPRSAWKTCACPAGTVVLADTRSIFHHGKSRRSSRSAIFLVYTAAQPLHPEHCTQYYDRTFARPELEEDAALVR